MTEINKIEDYWFMQDGTRPHRTREIFDLLGKKFKDRLIGLDSERYTGGGMDWPTYSPDLNPCVSGVISKTKCIVQS